MKEYFLLHCDDCKKTRKHGYIYILGERVFYCAFCGYCYKSNLGKVRLND